MELSIAISLSIFDIFQKNSNGVETKLVRLRLLSLNQIRKVVILKVAIKVDQGASTFGI